MSASVTLTTLGTSYKWIHTAFVFMTSLLHLTWCPQGSSLLQHLSEFPWVTRLSNTPLYVWTILFIPSSVSEQLSSLFWLQWLILVINAGVRISFHVLKRQFLILRPYNSIDWERISLIFWKNFSCCALPGACPGVCLVCKDSLIRDAWRIC